MISLIPDKFLSNRCIIRQAISKDVDALHTFFNHETKEYVREQLGWEDEDISKKTTKYCINYFKRYAKKSKGKCYYIFRKGKQDIIGTIDITHDRELNIRVNFYIYYKYRNNGYGTETHAAVIRELRRLNPGKQIIAEGEKGNKKSQNLLLRNGFRQVGSANCRFEGGLRIYNRKLLIFRSNFTP